MPASALIRLNEVTNELMELARASRANKVPFHRAKNVQMGSTACARMLCVAKDSAMPCT